MQPLTKKSPFKWKRLPSVRESTKERSGKNILSPHINNDNNVVIRFGAVAAFEKAFMDCFWKRNCYWNSPPRFNSDGGGGHLNGSFANWNILQHWKEMRISYGGGRGWKFTFLLNLKSNLWKLKNICLSNHWKKKFDFNKKIFLNLNFFLIKIAIYFIFYLYTRNFIFQVCLNTKEYV